MDLSNEYFVKLPNRLFYSNEQNEESILKIIGSDKAFPVLDYLYTNVNRKNIIKFTLEDMIVECGFKPNANEKKSNEQFRNVLAKYQQLEIIKSDFDMRKIKPKELISCSLEIDLTNKFVVLTDKEKGKILNQTIEKVDNLKLLIYFTYLKSRIYKRSKEDYDLAVGGGRAEVTWVGYKTINYDLGLTDETITKYNKILVDLNLIRIGSAGNWYFRDDKNRAIKESNNIYTLWTEGDLWELNLKEGIKYYKSLEINTNKVFTKNRKYLNNNRKLNGELGSIIKKEKLGTATEKDIKRKIEIVEAIGENIGHKSNIIYLLDKNKGIILSDIYWKLNSFDVADKYCELEYDLELINDEGKLVVSWEYYCWVMKNYEESQHDYFVNCIRKTIRECKMAV